MHCLDNYIGLRGCGAETPESGLYVNDLPGISLKQIVSLTNEEEATYLDLWDMVQRRGQNRFNLDVREAMNKYYRMKSLMQGVNLGNQIATTGIAPNGDWAGFTIELIDNPEYEFVPSPLASIHVQELRFYSSIQTNGLNFSINDLNTGAGLWGKQQDVNIGWNTIPVNQTFHNNYAVNSWSIACLVNLSGGDDIYSLQVPLSHTMPGCCDVRVRGTYNASAIDLVSNYQFSSDTQGLSGTFSIVCNWDALICQNKTLFSRAYWYLLGIELLTEQLYSSKLNQYTTVNLQRAKELREEYQVEYMKALDQVAGGMKLSCDCCLDCAEPVQLRESTSFY